MAAGKKPPIEDAGRKLAPYRAKRNFKVTAEPEGSQPGRRAVSAADLPFVVQKHAATRLHYDFRLGWKGVLKSWAVAKGPSLFPGDKRLAVQVEDHPMEYKDFEGTIPKGEYGGGSVMVWDQGTWEPHGDVDGGLAEGHLKFDLHGTKLKGSWVLVRMNGHGDRNGRPSGGGKSNWLLIKEHDKYERAQSAKPITETATRSVVTKRSLEQIAAAQGPVWRSANASAKGAAGSSAGEDKPAASAAIPAELKAGAAGAPREAFPGFIAPQLAQRAKEPPEGANWAHEIKLDGYRIQIHLRRGGNADKPKIELLTRNNLDWSARMKGIVAAAAALPARQAILDGEVVAFNDKGVADFAELQAAFQQDTKAHLLYVAFDLLHLDGRNLRSLPFLERKAILMSLLGDPGQDSVFRFSGHLQASGAKVFAEACRLGAEGIISKLTTAKYTSGRGTAWLKIKCGQEQELVVGGFTPRTNDSAGLGALLLGYYQEGKLLYAGRTGTGFSRRTQTAVRKRLDPLVQDKTPFANRVERPPRDERWVAQVVVAQVAFANWTRDNLVRQAVFKGLREDKPAAEVVREIASAAPPPASVKSGRKPVAERARKADPTPPSPAPQPAITHPAKVMDETTGMTKGALAAYYAAVADSMLPYIADRPLSIVRCPEGSSKPCFFQKHIGFGVPKSVKSISVTSRKSGVKQDYLMVDTAQGLAGLAQMGVLEIHSWGSRKDSLDKPDRITIDLDPDESISWKKLAATALDVRERLRGIGLVSFLKSTGGKGLHVVTPIRPEHEWPLVKAFVHAFVRKMQADLPDLYVTKMSKAVRKNRIFLDYLRNDRDATAIAPFSPRARAGAPVALPLEWKELKRDRMPVFRVPEFGEWKSRLKRKPWAAMDSLDQQLDRAALRAFDVAR